jgi:hypothetical protein
MSRRGAAEAGLIALAVLLGIAGLALWPVSPAGYRDRVVAIAQGTVSAVRTVTLLGAADQAHRVTPPYVASVMDSARDDVATSQHDLAVEPVAGPDAARLRDELAPLLDRAARLFADDDTAMRDGRDLTRLGDELESFVERYR